MTIVSEELLHMSHQLICLRNVLLLLSEPTKSNDDVLTSFVHLILEAWQFSDIACARLLLGQKEVTSANYKKTEWEISSDIVVSGLPIGTLAVNYLEECPLQFEGPFLKQECDFIETLTVELARYVERWQLLESKERQHRELLLYSSLLRHDLKNDLGVILANVDLTRMLIKNEYEILEETIHSTEVVCSRMMELLNSFGRSADTANQNLYELINKVSQNAQEIHKGLRVKVEGPEQPDFLFIPKSNLLPLVFENLLRNAAVHAGENCNVHIDLRSNESTVIIRFVDDGPGVSSKVRSKLFQKGVSTRDGGLGLYLSRQVIETMGGTIDIVSSNSGEGAVFEIRLPKVMIIE